MKIAVIGAGPIGGAIAAGFFDSGNEVHIIDVAKPIVDAINSNGFVVEVSTGYGTSEATKMEKILQIPAHTQAEEVGPVDAVILATKGVYSRNCIPTMKALCGESTIYVSAQNGIGNEDIIAEAVGENRVAYSTVIFGGRPGGPGKISISLSHGRKESMLPMTNFVIGNDWLIDRLKELEAAMSCDWFDIRYMEKQELDVMRWNKLIVNAVVNPIGAITEGSMDSQQSLQSGVDYGEKIIAEALAVAQAYGVPLSRKDISLIPDCVKPKITQGYRHYTSMCMDVVNRRLTENDTICGAILRGGKRFGIQTPYTQAIYWLIDVIEHTYEDRYTTYTASGKMGK